MTFISGFLPRVETRYGWPFVAITIGYLLLSSVFFGATPLQEAPDEAQHVGFILFLKEHGHLPDARRDNVDYPQQEATQAPLYYVLGALLISPLDTTDAAEFYLPLEGSPIGRADLPGTRHMFQVPRNRSEEGTARAIWILRGYSILLGFLSLFVIWRVLERIRNLSPFMVFFILSLIAFNPMWLFITCSVNNDNMVILLTSTVVYAFFVAWERSMRKWDVSILGVLTGLALLGKQSALALLPSFLLTLAWIRKDATRWLLESCLYLGAAGVVSGWWFVRNRLLYGEFLAIRTHIGLAFNGRPAFDPFALIREWEGFLKSYWGVFGAFNIIFSDWVYDIFFVISAFLLVGALVALGRNRALWRDPRLLFCLLLFAFNLLAVMVWTSRLWGSQGRLMFPSLPAQAALLGILAEGFRFPFSKWLLGAICAFLFSSSLWAALVLIPSSYF